MTFLNLPILLGLTGVAIPILIHLFNRRHAKIVDWGAMQFLVSSLTSRRRRVLIEEVLLMCIRCLLVALLVLAISRPLLPIHGAVSWVVILPALLAASVCAAIGTVSWDQKRARWILLSVAGALVLIGVAATMVEYWWQGSRWSGKGRQDVAIVIDASTSMMLKTDGQTTTFDRAVAEARQIVKDLKQGDAVTVILAGASARELSSTPISNTSEVRRLMGDLKPMGGTMDALGALNAAVANLARGNNPGKKIIVMTDSQKVGWDIGSTGRWRFLAEAVKDSPIKPQIICRTFKPSSKVHVVNAAIVDVALLRKVVGTDREVEVTVKVANSGDRLIETRTVMLLVDGKEIKTGTQTVENIKPGTTGTATFLHRFSDPGPHVVSAKLAGSDHLKGDDESHRAITVLDQLPVLIVDGGIKSGAEALAMAMAPFGDKGDGKKACLIVPTIVKVTDTDLMKEKDFLQYRMVVLANVPQLPKPVPERLAAYVASGGGLLIMPGQAALPVFYNGWQAGHTKLPPARLLALIIDTESPAVVSTKTFNHPALRKTVGDLSDIEDVLTLAHWELAAVTGEVGVSVCGRFNTGRPMLVERALGKGYVLMTAMSFDESESTLAARACSVTLVHELTYYLAAPRSPRANIAPAGSVALELQCPRTTGLSVPTADELATLGGSGKIEVITPSGARREAQVTYSPGAVQLGFADTAEPGVYRFVLPESLAGCFGKLSATDRKVPFAVYDDSDETSTERLDKDDFKAMGAHVKTYPAESLDEVTRAMAGEIPGEELWSYLALAALALVLGEIGLTRWIEARRHAQGAAHVDFSGEAERSEAFKARAKDILSGEGEAA